MSHPALTIDSFGGQFVSDCRLDKRCAAPESVSPAFAPIFFFDSSPYDNDIKKSFHMI